MPLSTGQMIQERYRIVSLLGQGGMGAVYRAWDTRLNVPVALKEMTPQPGLEWHTLAQLRLQFQQEAAILARLNHPNLVRVTDFFESEDNTYLVMDFVDGENLAARILREGRVPEAQALTWATQLLDALQYCHQQGIIHRDVKPQNVIIRPDGKAVLVDFGLVKLWDPNDPRTKTVMRGVGTPEYAPPEQYDSESGHTDPRSDVYGLGATLYHALSGQAPPTATMRMASPERFVPLRELAFDVTPCTESAVMRALELSRSARWPDAAAMATALRPAAAVQPADSAPPVASPSQLPPSTPAHRVPGCVWVGGGFAALLLVIGMAAAGIFACRYITTELGRATPTAAEVPASPTPPTWTDSGEMTTLDHPFGGLRMQYPSGWVVEFVSNGIAIAESQQVLDNMDWSNGAILVILSGPADEMTQQVDAPPTAEGLLEAVLASFISSNNATTGSVETRQFASQQGVGYSLEWQQGEQSIQGYAASYLDDDIGAVILTVAPDPRWSELWPALDRTFSSLVFYAPLESVERGTIELSQTQTAVLDPGGVDSWNYRSTSGDEYITIEVTGSGDWDPKIEVYDADGNLFASDDDSGGNLNPRLSSLQLPPGQYSLRVLAFSGYGEYRLAVRPASAPGGGSISYNETIESILEQGEHEEWTFEGQAGDMVDISMVGNDSLNDTYLELYGPDNALLITDDDSGGNLDALIGGYILPQTGQYRIVARAFSDGIGPYVLILSQVDIEVQSLEYGSSERGELTPTTLRNYWVFDGATGDVVDISMVGSGNLTDTYLELYGPDGTPLTYDDDSGDGLFALINDYRLPQSGSYRIVARAFSSSLGAYTISLEQAEIDQQSISYGETQSGQLTELERRHYWTFEGSAGDRVTISMVGQGALDDTYLELYGPDGALLITDDDSGEGFFALIENYTLPDTGTYTIIARAYSSDVGTYNLTLQSR